MGQRGIKKKLSVIQNTAFVAAALLAVWLMFKMFTSLPAGDRRLAEYFQTHRPAFNEMKAMLATNNPSRNPSANATVWSMEDYKRYLALKRQTGVSRAFVEDGEYHFQVVGPGTAGPAKTRIAVVWREDAPDHLVSTIDAVHTTGAEPQHAYRSLGDGWYLWIAK
jgi:hypothetical protein